MPREKYETLTEPMFYTLLCLREDCCGADIMARVSALTHDRVRIGPGTLYALLDGFQKAGFIRLARIAGRQRWYRLTPAGQAALEAEYARLRSLTADYEAVMHPAKEDAP